MQPSERQIDRERVSIFIEMVQALQHGRERRVTLDEYWPREIADAIQILIDNAVRREREACAVVADGAAESEGFVAAEIAASIRARE